MKDKKPNPDCNFKDWKPMLLKLEINPMENKDNYALEVLSKELDQQKFFLHHALSQKENELLRERIDQLSQIIKYIKFPPMLVHTDSAKPGEDRSVLTEVGESFPNETGNLKLLKLRVIIAKWEEKYREMVPNLKDKYDVGFRQALNEILHDFEKI